MSSNQTGEPSEPRPSGPDRLPNRLRWVPAVGCAGLGLACAAIQVAFVVRIAPWLTETAGVYRLPADIWRPLQPARWVANGAVLFLYEADGPRFDLGPLWPVVVAPGVAVGDYLKLSDSSQYAIPQPTMAIPMIVAAMTAAITLMAAAVWRITAPAATKTRLWAVAAMVGPAVLAAGTWFHGEDMLVVAFVLLAAASPVSAGWWAAAALLTKQTMLAYAPALVAACEPGRRRRFVVVAAGVPAAVMAMFLAASPRSLMAGLTGAPTCAECFTPSLWASLVWDDPAEVTATYGRVVWVGAAAATAWLWRRRCRDPQGLLAVLTAIALMRCLVFEAGVYAYYWVPAVLFTLVWSAREGRRLWLPLLGFAGLVAWHAIGDDVALLVWWAVAAAAAAVVWYPVLRSLGRPRPTGSARRWRQGQHAAASVV